MHGWPVLDFKKRENRCRIKYLFFILNSMEYTKPFKEPNLWIWLGQLKDFRRAQGRRHPLQIVLLIIIMAIMGGAKSERALARFAKNNKKSLVRHLKIERNEVPSRTAMQTIIQHLNFEELQNGFQHWASSRVNLKKKDFVSIDGKALRGTVHNGCDALQSFINLVSAFAQERKQVLATKSIHNKKESEIPTAREIIALLDLEGVTFTLDALHAQTETLQSIVKSKNHYIVGVKKNQKGLWKNIQEVKKSPPSLNQSKRGEKSRSKRDQRGSGFEIGVNPRTTAALAQYSNHAGGSQNG